MNTDSPNTVSFPEDIFVFVCCHTKRDARCGTCGPVLLKSFARASEKLNLKVSLFACSHVGGHKYAGNCIIIGRKTANGERAIDSYGYVTPKDTERLLQSTRNGNIVSELWRGADNMNIEEMKNALMNENKETSKFSGCGSGCECVDSEK